MTVSTRKRPVTIEPALRKSGQAGTWASAAAALFVFGAFTASDASAASYTFGDVKFSIDTTISAGATMRTSGRDCERVSLANGGCASGAKATGVNSDNGNLNFDRWDFTNAIARATMDIQATWENYGVFVRPRAYYDLVYANNNMRFRDLTSGARDELAYDFEILDAFVYANYNIGNVPTSIRFGKQALNWGESLFIPGGINAFQALDVTALRLPGSELREALTPMPMVYVSAGVTPDVTIEAFWQFAYEETKIDPAGSFFSTDDIAGPGSLPAYSVPIDDSQGIAAITLQRSADRGQNDTDQFGAAVRYFAADLGTGVDFGLYFVRYSSRLPFLGFQNGPRSFNDVCNDLFLGPCTTPAQAEAAFVTGANDGTYFYNFPSRIDTIGASFNTNVAGTALAGELSFTPDMPLAISDAELNASQFDGTGASGPLSGGLSSRWSSIRPAGPGEATLTHFELETWQGQFNTITSFSTSDPIPELLGAQSGVFVFNGGFVYVPDAGDYPLSTSGRVAGIRNPFAAALLANGSTDPRYATSFSTGYRALLSVDYTNPWNLPITLSPSVGWRHDVSGYSPGPITAGYIKGLKQVSLGVNVDYQNTWRGSISYVNSFGGGFEPKATDRDFVMANVSYSF